MPTSTKNLKERRIRNSLSRQEILKVSLSIVKESGIENLSMRKIAQMLKCSVASPYAYFNNRDEIIFALISNGEKILVTDLKIARQSSEDIIDQIKALAKAYWNFEVENRELHKLMFNSLDGSQKTLFSSFPASYRVFVDTLRTAVKNGKIKYSRKKYHALARTMWAWLYGVLILELTGMLKRQRPENDPIEEGIEFFKILLLQNESESA